MTDISTANAESAAENSGYVQQDADKLNTLLKLADTPLAARIFLLIVQKMNTQNALVASYHFFMDYFKTSKSSVRRAVQMLEGKNILQIKRSGGTSVYLINPEIAWKGKDSKYREYEGKIIFTETEWNEGYDCKE